MKKRQLWFLVLAMFFAAALYFLNRTERTPLFETEGRTFEKAEVTEILKDNQMESGQYVGQQKVLLLLRSGSRKGQVVEAASSASYLYGAHCTVGMKVIAAVNESGEDLYVTVYSYDRSGMILLIGALFFLSICALGGKKGVNSALGLLFTFICVVWILIPMIYRGVSPILAALLVAVLTTVATNT